jgi:ketosteroid isomerase-like protein
MSTLNQTPTDLAGQTTARYRTAAEAGDVDGVVATLAPDVVLHSPITDKLEFRGLATLSAALAPRVVERKHGRPRALLAKVLMAPLALMTRIGDRLIPFFG